MVFIIFQIFASAFASADLLARIFAYASASADLVIFASDTSLEYTLHTVCSEKRGFKSTITNSLKAVFACLSAVNQCSLQSAPPVKGKIKRTFAVNASVAIKGGVGIIIEACHIIKIYYINKCNLK